MKFHLQIPKKCSCGQLHTIIEVKPEEDGSCKLHIDPRDGSSYVWFDCFAPTACGEICGSTGIVNLSKHLAKQIII